MTLIARLRNAPDYPATGEIDILDNPKGTSIFRIANGTSNLPVRHIAEDPDGERFNDEVYLWFELEFPGEMTGWVRDEYLELSGEDSEFGFGTLPEGTNAFELIHGAASQPTDVKPEPEENDPTTQSELAPQDRLLRAALNVTAAFEGGYSSYQNRDSGIISYGRFQFTLAGGALFKVIRLYLEESESETAAQLRDAYLTRIRDRDVSLQPDDQLRALLKEAAREAAMQAAQDRIAEEKYWNLAQSLSIRPRGVQTGLGQALIFDMSINHGARHDMLTLAEEALGATPRSRLGENDIQEQDFIRKVAEVRRDRMYRLAEARNLPGLKPRADFWVKLVNAGDWDLMGDENGEVEAKSRRKVQVRNP